MSIGCEKKQHEWHTKENSCDQEHRDNDGRRDHERRPSRYTKFEVNELWYKKKEKKN